MDPHLSGRELNPSDKSRCCNFSNKIENHRNDKEVEREESELDRRVFWLFTAI